MGQTKTAAARDIMILTFNKDYEFKYVFGKISGYTTSFNAITMGYPFVESISSMLGFCDEVVVVDHSTDGTYEILEKMAADDPRIQLYQREWDAENPSMDGDAKAFARALTQYEFCWQQDLDECVHERDYEKIKWITKRFPGTAKILHLPVVECWGDAGHATGRRHSWKWRLSRNDPSITHGINSHARITDKETGKVYAKEGMSDGCEYVDQVSYDPLPHTGFYTQELEQVRLTNPEMYETCMNNIIERIPSVYHYSWYNLERKISQFRINWDRQWNVLYQKELPPRFPENCNIGETVARLYKDGGEPSDEIKYKYKLKHSHPAIMTEWINENTQQLKATGT